MNKPIYRQCEIQHENNGLETAWIPYDLAKKGQKIILGKHKITGKHATVMEVFTSTNMDKAKTINDWSKAHKRTDIPRRRNKGKKDCKMEHE